MDLSRIPAYGPEGSVNVLVEIPRGSRNKYEYDEASGVIRLNRTLYAAVHYPTDYGFVPGTRGRDGDPVDVLVLVEEPAFPGCLVRVRLVAVLTITHRKGPERSCLASPSPSHASPPTRTSTTCPRTCSGRSSTSLRSSKSWGAAISTRWGGRAVLADKHIRALSDLLQ